MYACVYLKYNVEKIHGNYTLLIYFFNSEIITMFLAIITFKEKLSFILYA